MGFKTGAMVGFGVGYYLGTQAGRERYEQINQWIDQLRGSEAVTAATEKVREFVDESDLTSTTTTGNSSNN